MTPCSHSGISNRLRRQGSVLLLVRPVVGLFSRSPTPLPGTMNTSVRTTRPGPTAEGWRPRAATSTTSDARSPVPPCTSVPAPAPGNFGEGYYSFDIGAWHAISSNANCRFTRGCKAGSPQEEWLAADLAAHPNSEYPCTLAFWHQPRFASAKTHGADASSDAFWRDLDAAGADLALNGHLHAYERFAPHAPDANGVSCARVPPKRSWGREGRAIRGYGDARSEQRCPQDQAQRDPFAHAEAIKFRLAIVTVPGQTFQDSGSADCHEAAVKVR